MRHDAVFSAAATCFEVNHYCCRFRLSSLIAAASDFVVRYHRSFRNPVKQQWIGTIQTALVILEPDTILLSEHISHVLTSALTIRSPRHLTSGTTADGSRCPHGAVNHSSSPPIFPHISASMPIDLVPCWCPSFHHFIWKVEIKSLCSKYVVVLYTSHTITPPALPLIDMEDKKLVVEKAVVVKCKLKWNIYEKSAREECPQESYNDFSSWICFNIPGSIALSANVQTSESTGMSEWGLRIWGANSSINESMEASMQSSSISLPTKRQCNLSDTQALVVFMVPANRSITSVPHRQYLTPRSVLSASDFSSGLYIFR